MMPDYQPVWGLPLDCMARHECDSYALEKNIYTQYPEALKPNPLMSQKKTQHPHDGPVISCLYYIYSHDYPIITG